MGVEQVDSQSSYYQDSLDFYGNFTTARIP